MFTEIATLIENRDNQALAAHLWAMSLEDLERIAQMEPEAIGAALEAEGYGMQCV